MSMPCRPSSILVGLLALIALAGLPQTIWSQSDDLRFVEAYDALLQRYVEAPGPGYSGVDYVGLAAAPERAQVRALLEAARLPEGFASGEKALLLDAYNFLVLDAVAEAWPLGSVRDDAGFFTEKRHRAFGERYSLDGLEKQTLYKRYPDPRLHLALVCGAVGCPPLWNRSYALAAEQRVRDAAGAAPSSTAVARLDEAAYAEAVDALLDAAARRAVNRSDLVREDDGQARLSRIFEWYADDFGGSTAAVLDWINRYRDNPLQATRAAYLPYDWKVNQRRMPAEDVPGELLEIPPIERAPNSGRYVVSSTIPRGTAEIRLFNNLYSQRTRNAEGSFADRSTFFTSQLSALYALNDRFMLGVEGRYRMVRNGMASETPFSVFAGSGENGSFRQGLTTIGPKIRWAPNKRWPNFSVQSAFWIPLGDSLSGSSTEPYLDWDGSIWWTQFFNDFSIGSRWSLFTEIDVLWEDIGSAQQGRINRVSTPVTVIATYLPRWDWSVYGLIGYSPYWQSPYDWFGQAGVGVKHQFTRKVELELLYTGFTNRNLVENDGRAQTINLGLRVNVGN